VHRQGDLVERALSPAGPRGVVIGPLTLLELVHDLTLTRALPKLGAAGGDLGVLAVEIESRLAALTLGTLDVRLGGNQVDPAGAGTGHEIAAGRGSGSRSLGRLEQHRLSAQAETKLMGQLLASALFRALSERPNALETEDEGRSLHVPGDRPSVPHLELIKPQKSGSGRPYGPGTPPLDPGDPMRKLPLALLVSLALSAAAVPTAAQADPNLACFGGYGEFKVVGTARADVLVGTPGPDAIFGAGGNDLILGRGGDDLLCGGAGNDHINGGDGDDQTDGDRGHDVVIGGAGGDGVFGGYDLDERGDDLLVGGPGDDYISYPGGGENRLFGGDGNDQVQGGDENDRLSGGRGNDELDGYLGWDVGTGGPGTDTCGRLEWSFSCELPLFPDIP
jgi:hypothetical protein